MADHYGDESQSASDQEELVGNSDLDDDLSDYDEVQFNNFCKPTSTENDLNAGESSADQMSSQYKYRRQQQQNYDFENFYGHKSRIIFFIAMIALFLTAFALLLCFPLYIQQLSVEGKQNNAYGAILYTSTVITLIFLIIAVLISFLFKWDVKLFKFPIEWKR